MERTVVHHIALVEDWQIALDDGVYAMSTRGATLDEVGFIHCARPDQIIGVLNRYYHDVDEVLLLDIDVDGLDIRDEPVELDTGIDYFPHLFGHLPISAVIAARKIRTSTS
jgi:glutathione S-transferase